MATMEGAEFIANMLHGYGITHVFLQEAILRKSLVALERKGVKRIVTHSEKSAAYMADGYARAGLKPAVCMCQSVGAANLAAGLQDAYLGNSPVIALTGKKPALHQYRHAYQEIDHIPLFEPVTKYNVACEVIEQLPFLLRQAFRAATTGCPGPAHIDVIDNLGRIIENAGIDAEVVVEPRFTRIPAFRPRPDEADVSQAVELIKRADRPVIIAGRGCILSGAQTEISNLAQMLQIPVATSVDGKGTISDRNPLSIGCVGDYSVWCANQIVSDADLVIFIGTGTGDQVTLNWTIPAMGTTVIQIDIDPTELGINYPNSASLLGDAKTTVKMLSECLTKRESPTAWSQYVQDTVRRWHEEVEPLRNSYQVPIRPERLCQALTAALPAESILVADTGFSAIWTAGHLQLTKPTQTYIRAAGGSLGWSFPASLGAQCACPDQKVICFSGDGAFWYHMSDLETQVRHDIKSVTIVNNNGGYGQCRPNIIKAYGQAIGKHEDLWAFGKFSFAELAQQLGLFSVRVNDPDKIESAIRKAIEADVPALVEVVTDMNVAAPLGWRPGK